MEIPLFGKNLCSCAKLDTDYLTTTKTKDQEYYSVFEYRTQDGIFTETVGQATLSALEHSSNNYATLNESLQMCIHIKTRKLKFVDRARKDVLIGVHGFFSEIQDPSLLESLKLRFHISLISQHKERQDVSRHAVITSEIDLSFPSFLDGSGADYGCFQQSLHANTCSIPYSDIRWILASHCSSDYVVSGTIKAVFFRDSQSKYLNICKMLEETKECGDFSIIASNGTEFACSKDILAAHSPVFASRFAKVTHESKRKKLNMKDISEEAVKAFLDFIYERDTTLPMESCQVALQLLQIGHKDQVTELETIIRRMLLAKPNNWFQEETALHLFIFSRNVETFKDLKKKAVDVIRSSSRGISQSEVYKDFFTKNPIAALDLFESAIN